MPKKPKKGAQASANHPIPMPDGTVLNSADNLPQLDWKERAHMIRTGMSRAQLAKYLETRDPEPFTQALAKLIRCQPTEQALLAFANKFPDRWAHALEILAALSGFEKRPQSQTTITIINEASDSELMRRMRDLDSQIHNTIEGQATPQDQEQTDQPDTNSSRPPTSENKNQP